MSAEAGSFMAAPKVIQQGTNFIGDLTGANRQIDAMQGAANANLAQQKEDRSLALKYASASPEELAQLQESITMNSQDLERRKKILASADPALIEAGNQALALLQGKESSAVAPFRNERNQQREQLKQTLAQQLGPDYATSTAGIQALNNFDQQTASLGSQVQQQSLAQLLGVTNNAEQFGNIQGNIANSSALAGQYGNIGTRQANAITGNRIDPGQAFIGDLSRAQYQGQIFNAGTQTLASLMGAPPGSAPNLSMGGSAGNGSAMGAPKGNPFNGSGPQTRYGN
jgi:hypothetical protein